MALKKPKITRATVLYWVVLNIGTLLLAAGVYFFKAPRNFATGGVSGLSILLAKFTVGIPWLGQTEIMTSINVLLLIIRFIFLGKDCGFKTAYCSLVYSGEMQIMKLICPIEQGTYVTNDVFLDFVYAMLLTAAGSAIIFNCRASSGGTDIVALIIKKYTKVKNVGTALLITDFFIAASTFFVFGDITTGLYSLLGLFAKTFIVDGVIENIGKNKFVTIITTAPELITPFILEGIHRGYTSYKATGGYTGDEKTIIITVCKRGEALKLKMRIHAADSSAFVILTDTNEIVGKGFRETL